MFYGYTWGLKQNSGQHFKGTVMIRRRFIEAKHTGYGTCFFLMMGIIMRQVLILLLWDATIRDLKKLNERLTKFIL